MRAPAALAGAFLFILSCTVAQSPSPTSPKRPVAIVELENGGSFTIGLRPDQAPNTVANFVSKVKDHKYDNLTFHRVEDWVVQGGDPLEASSTRRARSGTWPRAKARHWSKAVRAAAGSDSREARNKRAERIASRCSTASAAASA